MSDRASEGASAELLEDLLASHEEWGGVPEVVQLGFKAVLESIHLQHKGHLQQVRKLKESLTLKANSQDVARWVDGLGLELSKRVSSQELHEILLLYYPKEDVDSMFRSSDSSPTKKDESIKDIRQMAQTLDRHTKELASLKQSQLQTARSIRGQAVERGNFADKKDIGRLQTRLGELERELERLREREKQRRADKERSPQAKEAAWLGREQFQRTISKLEQDWEQVLNLVDSKIDIATIEKLTHVIDNKSDKADLAVLQAALAKMEKLWARQAEQVRSEPRLQKRGPETKDNGGEQRELLALRRDISTLQAKLTSDIVRLQQQVSKRSDSLVREAVEELRGRVEEGLLRGLNKKQFIQFKAKASALIEDRVSRDEVEQIVESGLTGLERKLAQLAKDFELGTSSAQCGLRAEFEQFVRKEVFLKEIAGRAGREEMEELATAKARECLSELERSMSLLTQQLEAKVSKTAFQLELDLLRGAMEEGLNQRQFAPIFQDISESLRRKPSVEQVNRVFKQLIQDLDGKATREEVRELGAIHKTVKKVIVTQLATARWLFQSGKLKSGGLIPWEVAVSNLSPTNYLWEPGKTSVIVEEPGVFEVRLTLFCRRPTLVTLRVDAQDVSAREFPKEKKDGGQRGLVFSEVVRLTGRKKVSFSVTAEGYCSALLSIRKQLSR